MDYNSLLIPTLEICKHQLVVGFNLIEASTFEICKHRLVVGNNLNEAPTSLINLQASTSKYHSGPAIRIISHRIHKLQVNLQIRLTKTRSSKQIQTSLILVLCDIINLDLQNIQRLGL